MSFEYELVIRHDGTLALTQGGEVMWTSDNDDDFSEEFGEEVFDADDADDVLDYLEENDYIPPDVEVSIVDEAESESFEADEDPDDEESDDE